MPLVAMLGEQLIGHVAFSEVGPPALEGWFALEEGLRRLRAQRARGCVLVGDHRYYQRFGFSGAPELAPSGIPAEHFQVLPFGASRPHVPVVFHAAFSA